MVGRGVNMAFTEMAIISIWWRGEVEEERGGGTDQLEQS